jgi:hypothetical protein
MTKSYNTDRYPDADYTPNDVGPPERSNGPQVKFEDLERTDEYWEKMAEMELDLMEPIH